MILKKLAVSNYRTLEDFDVTFMPHYNSICGKNNSGKSNIVRAIRLLFNDINERFFFDEDIDFSYTTDLCAWKKNQKDKEKITISGTIEITRALDEGLFLFIESLDSKKTNISSKLNKLDINLTIQSRTDKPTLHLESVLINGSKIINSVVANNIYDKIKKSIVFHNSTHTLNVYFARSRKTHGIYSQIPKDNKEKIDKKSLVLKKEINKVFREHANDLQAMLGKLGAKLQVKLDTPQLEFEQYPYEISLGYRDMNIPLDDWGSGTRNQTLIIKSIFEATKAKHTTNPSEKITPIVLIEEPESFLHPLAQAQFSDVLQSLTKEWDIQIITTTHSAHMLSHLSPEANILLDRNKKAGRSGYLLNSYRVPFHDENWRSPFEHALGICGPDFEIFKEALFSETKQLLLVEGKIDKEYFEMLQKNTHGKNALVTDCDIFSYDGKDKIKNDILLKFIKERFPKVVITSDLDAKDNLQSKLENVGYKLNKTYIPIGKNQAGNRDIEGLLPPRIKQDVHNKYPDLVTALRSDVRDEVRQSKNELKKKYLEHFKENASIEQKDFSEFYKLVKKINNGFKIST